MDNAEQGRAKTLPMLPQRISSFQHNLLFVVSLTGRTVYCSVRK
jgi:hypothetical protein